MKRAESPPAEVPAGLGTLVGRRVGDFRLRLGQVDPGRFPEEVNFALHLERGGRICGEWVVRGKFFAGRGRWLLPWVEFYYRPSPGKGWSIGEAGAELFRRLAGPIPPGGALMVKYGDHPATGRALLSGVPPMATPLGLLLWRAGCRWYKDWYFTEGWREGGDKLQGNKPLDPATRRARETETRRALEEFLARPPPLEPHILKTCRTNARALLAEVKR